MRGIQLLFLLILAISQLILLFPQGVIKEAQAQTITRHCFYTSVRPDLTPLAINTARPISSAAVSYPTKTAFTDGKSVTGFTAHLILDFAFDDTKYISDISTCTAEFADTYLYIGGAGIRNFLSFYSDKLEVTNLKIEQISQPERGANGKDVTGVHTRVTGDVKLTNDNIAQSFKAGMLAATDPATYQSYFYFYPYSSTIHYSQVPSDSMSFVACPNSTTTICVILPGDAANPVASSEKNIPLSELKLFSRLNAQTADFAIGNLAPEEGQNFYRTYLEDDKKTIHPLSLISKMIPAAPTSKTLVINQNHTASSQILFDKAPTIAPRIIFSLGAGFVQSGKIWAKSGDYGCSDASLYSDSAGFTNDAQTLNWCQFEESTKAEIQDQVSLKMDGKGSKTKVITFNNQSLSALVPDIVYLPNTCTVDSCTESETTANKISYLPFLTLDKDTTSTTLGGALFPSFLAKWSALKNFWYGVPLIFPARPIYIEIYPSKAVWEKHKNDPVPSWVPKATDAGGSAQVKGGSASQTLYGFIVRVISDIIVWLQSIIYAVFATILVPILNALLRVRPYQDLFVNIIYPGWLILRNLANIFFIVSLLVVGMRILFQQSAAGAARSFILRLVIMALLVNFSLVIAQGLVGIADTVQSQFLPANTKVIESLGQKLMVEPLKTFREEVNDSANGAFTEKQSELALADTIKPIVLLMLTIASFFSFAALAAFLLVRLVALWVLYMLSPIAYVGYVMDETKSYASRWWSEFLKYAIVTPVLVFFLNIAALMATLFSGQNNSLFKFSEGSNSGDIVAGSLTIISHFIVLFFIYAGMKFALSSGTAGAKTIVDYAKKGYDSLTSRPAKWVGGQAKEAAKTQWDRRFKDGMLDPFAYRDAFKKRVADTTKEKYGARILRNAEKLSPAGFFQDPKQALRYMYYKSGSGSPDALKKRADKISDQQKKMTADERKKVETKLLAEQDRLDPMKAIQKQIKSKDPLSTVEGEQIVDDILDETVRLEGDKIRMAADLRAEALTDLANGNEDASKAKNAQATALEVDYDKKIKDYNEIGDSLGKVVVAAQRAGNVNLDHLDAQLKQDINERLEKDIEELSTEIKKLGDDIKSDERRKVDYGSAPMTLPERAKLEAQKEKLIQKANERRAPESENVRKVRREMEDDAKKKIEDTDDTEELISQYKKAMEKNNLPLATAIMKKLSAEGGFTDLLKDQGYRNNVTEIQDFINKSLKEWAPQVRLQVMSEVGAINKKNNNSAGSALTKIDSKTGVMRLSSVSEQAAKINPPLAKKVLSAAKTMKPHEFGAEGTDGRLELFSGAQKLLNQFKTLKKPPAGAPSKDVTEYERKIRTYQQDWAGTANAILKASNSNIIDDESIKVLTDIATQKIN